MSLNPNPAATIMFNFMDNLKKVASNVQGLAVNVMNELDEGGGGSGNEHSPNHHSDFTDFHDGTTQDGPLQRLKKDASAASQMINSAVNMFGEDEMFITLLAKFIKQNIGMIEEDSRNSLLKEWLNIYEIEYSNSHSADSLVKLSDLAVTINDSFHQQPSLEGIGKQFTSLKTANARMSTEIDRLRQQLNFLSVNSTDPVMAFANDRTTTTPSMGPPVARVSPMNTMEIKANDEKNLAVIKKQSEKIDQQQKQIGELEEQILNLEEIIQQQNIQIQQIQEEFAEAETEKNEDLIEELAKKDSIIQKFEEKLLQEKGSDEEVLELKLRLNEVSQQYQEKLRECEGRLDDEKRQVTLFTEELNDKHEKIFEFGNDMYKLKGSMNKMEVQKDSELKDYEKKLVEEKQKVENLNKDLKLNSKEVIQLKKSVNELEAEIWRMHEQKDDQHAKEINEMEKECSELKSKQAKSEARIEEIQNTNDSLQKATETLMDEFKKKLAHQENLQDRIKELEEENDLMQKNQNNMEDIEALKNELTKKESALEELEKEMFDSADQAAELEKRIIELQNENTKLQENGTDNQEVEALKEKLSSFNNLEAQFNEIKTENESLKEMKNTEISALKTELEQKEAEIEDLGNTLIKDKKQMTELKERVDQLQNENIHLQASSGNKEEVIALQQQLSKLEQRASEFEKEKVHLLTSANQEISNLKDELQQKQTDFDGLQEKMAEVYKQISELESRANNLDKEKANLQEASINEINALKTELSQLSELKTKITELENESIHLQEAAQTEINNLKDQLLNNNEAESRINELENEYGRLQELAKMEAQQSQKIKEELENASQKLSALEIKYADQQDLLKQSAIECEKIAAQCNTFERENEKLKAEMDKFNSQDPSEPSTNALEEKYKQLEADFKKAILTRDEALALYENHKVQLIQSQQSFASLEEELRNVNNITQQELQRMQTTLFAEQEQLKERLHKETAELMHANEVISTKESEVNELQREIENMQIAYQQLTEKLLNQEITNSTVSKESPESEHLQALRDQLQLVSNECENFKKQIHELQTKLGEKTAEAEHYQKQVSKINTHELEELTAKYEAAKDEAHDLRNEIRKLEENQKKLKSHVQKLTDNLQAKDEEVLLIAGEMENQAVSLKADFNPDEIRSLKKMIQSATQEIKKHAEKAEQLKLIISQNTMHLKEKDEMILKWQDLHETLRSENENIVAYNKQLHEELEKASTHVAENSSVALKKLENKMVSLSQQYDIIKQAFFKMIIDEDHAHDHCLLLINFLDYDTKSRDVLRDYVNAKYQGKLEHFWQKFNFKSSAQLAQQLLDFVDQDIAKSKIALAAPDSEPAFQMNIDEPLPNPSNDDGNNDLRSIL